MRVLGVRAAELVELRRSTLDRVRAALAAEGWMEGQDGERGDGVLAPEGKRPAA